MAQSHMTAGQRGQMPGMNPSHKKTNLSQLLNPAAQPQPDQLLHQNVPQQYQHYQNVGYSHSAQQWNPRNNYQENASNPYPDPGNGYFTSGQWTGYSLERNTISGHDQTPHVSTDALSDQNHHHPPMLAGSTQNSHSELQYSERASTRIQARNIVEPPPNYNESYDESSRESQGEPSRKRNAAVVERVGPPKKAKKTSATTAANSKRGFTKKKRTEAEGYRAQNAFLVPSVSYVNEKGNESASASDNRMRMIQPGESSSFGAGKLTPELQTARCMSSKYKAEDFPRCVSCTRRWQGDTCRFQGVRIFLKNEKKEVVGVSFVNNQRPEKPTMDFPKEWNVKLTNKDLLWTMRVTARQLLPILQAERKHVDTQQIIYRPRENDVRATCDTCMTSLFCCSWMCRLCGRESCPDCYEEVVAITGDPNADLANRDPSSPEIQAQKASRLAAQKSRKEKQSHSNPFFLTCTKRAEHRAAEFTPVSRFYLRELDEAIRDMEAILKGEEESGSTDSREINSSSSTASESTGVRTPPDSISTTVTEKDVRYQNGLRYLDQSQPSVVSSVARSQQSQSQPYVSQLQAAHAPHLPPAMSSGYHQPLTRLSQQEQYAVGASAFPHTHSQLQQNTFSYDSYSSSNSTQQQQQHSSYLGSHSQANSSPIMTAPSSSSIPLYHPPSHNVDIPLHPIPTYTFDALTPSTFRSVWNKGIPILVTEVGRRLRIQWTPEYFIQKYGDRGCLIVECQTDDNKRVTVGEFFSEFGKYTGQDAGSELQNSGEAQEPGGSGGSAGAQNISRHKGEIWKLKDWPPSADFKTTFPELYQDFSQAVPIPNYVRRDGTLNMASHFPLNAIAPDLGPKMYNAMASNQKPGSKGSTRLHMDMADALNIMTFAADCPDGSPGCAAWDLFRAEDSVKLRAYLKDKLPSSLPTDPIHGQQVYLNEEMRKDLAEKWGVYSFRVYQRPGEAVFIPAGCAHQVCNLSDCIKVAVDFVSPENVRRCERLTKEFREQNQSKVWKEDILQLNNMMWFAWLSCSQQWGNHKSQTEVSSATLNDNGS